MPHRGQSIEQFVLKGINSAFTEDADFIGLDAGGRKAYITTPSTADYYIPRLKEQWSKHYKRPYLYQYLKDNLPPSITNYADGQWSGWAVTEINGRSIPVISAYYPEMVAIAFVPPDRFDDLREYATARSAYVTIPLLQSVKTSSVNTK